jgi:DUF1680 family protein
MELYRETGESSYRDLATRMVDLRGTGVLGEGTLGRQYYQDHAPVREAHEATGHAVRQLYLAAGVMDAYQETGDESLLIASERIWENAFQTKTYVTGGQGSRHRDESFGDPYELPSDRAYAETCAAIASFMWNWRLLLATGNGRYADEMERGLHNAIAAAVSLDGRHFFYSNPLQLRPGHDGSNEDAPSERLPWYRCACCPPNVARLVASLQAYLATADDSGIQIHQYADSRIRADVGETPVELEIRSEYPWDGRVAIAVLAGHGSWTLSLRVPEWARDGLRPREPIVAGGR